MQHGSRNSINPAADPRPRTNKTRIFQKKRTRSAMPLLRHLPQCCANGPLHEKMWANRVKKVTRGCSELRIPFFGRRYGGNYDFGPAAAVLCPVLPGIAR